MTKKTRNQQKLGNQIRRATNLRTGNRCFIPQVGNHAYRAAKMVREYFEAKEREKNAVVIEA